MKLSKSTKEDMRKVGINHVIIAPVKDATRPTLEIVQEIAEYILPHFPVHE